MTWTAHELRIEMTCPLCAHDLEVFNAANSSSREHVSLWRCVKCREEWSVSLSLSAVAEEEGFAHGTWAGYQRHRRERTEPCDRCRQACVDTTANWKKHAQREVMV